MLTLPFSLPGFAIQEISSMEHVLVVSAASTSDAAVCPSCDQASQQTHSYAVRSPQDLPMSGQTVRLQLRVRRFRCQNQRSARQTFAERVPDVVSFHAQRTQRLTATLTLFLHLFLIGHCLRDGLTIFAWQICQESELRQLW